MCIRDSLEGLCVGDGQLGQSLAVHLDAGLLEAVHKAGIVDAVGSDGRGNTGNPQLTELSLLQLTANVSVNAGLCNSLLGHLKVTGLGTPVGLCELQGLISSLARHHLSLIHISPMEGSREAIIIAEGIHMLNPLLFDPMRSRATGVYVAPRTRIITPDDRIVKPEQVRVARRMIRDYLSRGRTLRETIERAQSVDQGEVQYIAPNKKNASIHIDTFHDYEPCILTKYLREIPKFSEELTPEFMRAHNLDILMAVSYTHLDVYKRQTISCARTIGATKMTEFQNL